ncbi:MAG: hypothetical protein LiPW41_294 [Parcubacteria group bacterium LiPW_41]|nr:MAG: hypothetical protein LiPW41_294 [Parcubacteria group bacterium LiPW_41]
MEKKIIISAIVGFLVGVGAYFLFVSPSTVENGEIDSDSVVVDTATSSDLKVTVESKKFYTADVRSTTITLYNGEKKSGVINAGSGDTFVSAFAIEKTGDRFFVVVKHNDSSIDFGILTSENQKFEMLTKESGIKNIVDGVVFSPQKQYAAFQYLRDQGECKKDLMLAVVSLKDGKISVPEIKRSYEIGTGKLQAEMGGYRFDGDEILQFMDMPRACDNAGDYNAQKYYSWNIKTGESKVMEF